MKTGGWLNRLAFLAAFVLAWLVSACAGAVPVKWDDRIATFLRGRFAVEGDTMFYVAEAHARIDESGRLTLEIEADPMFVLDFQADAMGMGGVKHYTASIRKDAVCNPEGQAVRVEGAMLAVRKENGLVDLHDALRNAYPGDAASLPAFQAEAVPTSLSEADWRRVRECENAVAAHAASLPFSRLEIYAGEEKLADVFRPRTDSKAVELGVGQDAAVTAIAVKSGAEEAVDFAVEVQAVSSVACDYEGPHLELDDWKQGFSAPKALRREGGRFVVDPGVLVPTVPPIPAYTERELRRAINARFGQPGLASPDQAKPCSPSFRGYRFTVKYQGLPVYRIDVYEAGGC